MVDRVASNAHVYHYNQFDHESEYLWYTQPAHNLGGSGRLLYAYWAIRQYPP